MKCGEKFVTLLLIFWCKNMANGDPVTNPMLSIDSRFNDFEEKAAQVGRSDDERIEHLHKSFATFEEREGHKSRRSLPTMVGIGKEGGWYGCTSFRSALGP